MLNKFKTLFVSKGKHLVTEGIRLSFYNLIYILASIMVVVITAFLIAGVSYLFNRADLDLPVVISLLFMVVLLEVAVAGAGYFVLWIRFIKSDRRNSSSSHKNLRAFAISCLGVIPNVVLLFLLPMLMRLWFPMEDDSCGGFLWPLLANLVFSVSAIVMPLVGALTGNGRTPPQVSS